MNWRVTAFFGSVRTLTRSSFDERREAHDHRQAADELGDQAVLQQVLGHELVEQGVAPLVLRLLRLRPEADAPLADALLDDLLETLEGAAADEQDVRGVDLDEVLVRVLPAALRRDVGDRALEDLQQRLLDALAGDVTGDRRVVGLARDLVDLVDVDDPALRALDVEVRGLDEAQQDVLDVLADVAGLGQARRIGDAERHVEDLGQRLGEERLAAAGRADEQDVRLPELDIVDRVAGVDALVVVVDRHGEDLLRLLLADDVRVELVLDLPRARERCRRRLAAGARRLEHLLFDDLLAEVDALVADVDALPRDQLADLLLALAAEAAAVRNLRLRGHRGGW